MDYNISLLASVLIFLTTLSKIIFDLIINPYIRKQQVENEKKENDEIDNYISIGIATRKRSDRATTIAFIFFAIATLSIIWEKTMYKNISVKEFNKLEDRVNRLEKVIFPPDSDGHKNLSLMDKLVLIEERINKIENDLVLLQNNTRRISIRYAKKTKNAIKNNIKTINKQKLKKY